MVEFRISRNVDVSALKAWQLLENFGDISWAPGIEKVEQLGDGIGMIRRIYMPGMEPIDEQLLERNAEKMWFKYAIPRGLPMPMSDYTAEGKVVDLGDGRCRLEWLGRCEPNEGLTEEDAENVLEQTYVMLLDWIAAELTA